MAAYETIENEIDQLAAARALDRLEAIDAAFAEAFAAIRAAARTEPDADLVDMFETLAELVGEAVGDAGLARRIRRIDAALAAFAGRERPARQGGHGLAAP